MRSPTVTEIPPPPPGRTGWPWTEGSCVPPGNIPDGCPWPRISIVTPSYTQGQFIETIRSVLLQGYPNLEYLITNGVSNDESVEIIRKYEPWLTHWVSEPDAEQVVAIHRHFARHRSFQDVSRFSGCRLLNDWFRLWGHRFIYDFETLASIHQQAGFVSLEWTNFGQSRHRYLQQRERHVDTEWMQCAFVAIYEATKPDALARRKEV